MMFGFIAVWNAHSYPPLGGFDAAEHIDYARAIADRGELPVGGAAYTPPGFYVLAAGAIKIGEALDLDQPERAAQYLNAVLGIGTALLLWWLARLLFPRRPIVSSATLGFFLACPIVLRTVAMFHPQPLALFLSTLALVLTARMIVERRYALWDWVSLALTLAATQLTRSVGLWTVGVVILTLVVTAVAQPGQRRRIRKGLGACAAAALLLALPWYIHLELTTDTAIFGRGFTAAPLADRWPGAFYVSPGLPDVFAHPHRGDLPPRFFPMLYADTWGDYFGIWSWNPPRPELTPHVNRRLVVQSIVGLPLTVLALSGFFALLALAIRRWREVPEQLLVVLMPLVSLAGSLYYALHIPPSPDGDTVKAMFLLTAVPSWALSFGFAMDVLAGRSRRLAISVAALLALCAAVSVAFATFAFVS
jgi:4-amino-4-deoxy-L-arabinose transferase-like glycosyltransferase